MKQNDLKETPELVWSSHKTTIRNTSQKWLKVIDKDLSGDVKLDVFKDLAEITIPKLINVTRDR